MAREVPLTQEKVAIVDDADFARVMEHRWCAMRNRSNWYAVRGGSTEDGKRRLLSLHRFLLEAGPDQEVDHRNGNGLDCRRTNLRLCTRGQNARNSRRPRDNTTGYKGVALIKKTGRYVAQISVERRHFYLGVFDSAEEAARSYDEAARRLHGEFARVNCPFEVKPCADKG